MDAGSLTETKGQLDIDDVVAEHPKAKAELARLRAALRSLVDRDVMYVDSQARLLFTSHYEAIKAFRDAREVLS